MRTKFLLASIFLMGSASSAANLYIAPGATGTGTKSDPTSLPKAIAALGAGDTIWVSNGTYEFSEQITIDSTNNGTTSKPKCLMAVAGAAPVFDFSSQVYVGGGSSNPRGIQINGDFWHLKGLSITGSADNGIMIAGNHNIIERCRVYKNKDTGLQISRQASSQTSMADWPSYNLILNCDAWDNYDEPGANGQGGGENADGFAAKLTCGPGNVFRGCIAHHNIDDGWDLFAKPETGPIGTVTFDRCIAYANGTLTTGFASTGGDRNGFKLGGSDIPNKHILNRCVAYGNGKNGFTWNSNPGEIVLANTLAFDNSLSDGNYKFGASGTPSAGVFYNNASVWTGGVGYTDKHDGVQDVDSSNCWWDKSKTPRSRCKGGRTLDASDFAKLSVTTVPVRLADGSIDFSPFAPSPSGDLVNRGTTPPSSALVFDATGYWQGAADLGAVELGAPTGVSPRTSEPLVDRLGFQSPRSGIATVRLYSSSGRSLVSMPLRVSAGHNDLTLPTGIHPSAVLGVVDLDGILLHRGTLTRMR
jgi:hypothetical protein